MHNHIHLDSAVLAGLTWASRRWRKSSPWILLKVKSQGELAFLTDQAWILVATTRTKVKMSSELYICFL